MQQNLKSIKYYCKIAWFAFFSNFAMCFPAYRKFKRALLLRPFTTKPVALFFFGRFGQGGAENYINSIIDVLSSRYECLIIVESKSINHITGMFELLSLEEFSSVKVVQCLLVQYLLNKIKPEICANVTSASFFRAYIAKRRTILSKTNKRFFFFFSKRLFLDLDLNVVKHIYQDATFVISDNQRSLKEIQEEYGEIIKTEKNICLYNKVKFDYSEELFDLNMNIALQNIQYGESIKLLWASRLDDDKNLQLLVDFSVSYPEIYIDVYGESLFNNAESLIMQLFKLPNICYCGRFNNIQQILGSEFKYSAFMFTSYWEGLPNILLEVGLLGLPIIAPDVGGVNELINDDTGYLVGNNINGYYDGLNSLINNLEITRSRVLRLRDLILYRHGTESYKSNVDHFFVQG